MPTRTPASTRLAVAPSPDPPTSALIRSVAAATLVAAALRAFRIGHQSLWIDEVFTWQSAGGGTTYGLREVLENVHGPLYSVALHLWMRLAGESEWALRAPSALAGVLTVPALAVLAHRWLGRACAAPAAWLAAGSPFLVWYSQEARNYAWLILWSVVSMAGLLELQRRATGRTLLGALGALAAGVLTNLSFALLAPLQLRLWLGGDRAQRRRRAWMLAGAAAAMLLLVSPWLPSILGTWDWRRLGSANAGGQAESDLRGTMAFHPAAVPFALHAFAVGYTLGPSLRELRGHPGMGTLARHAGELAATAAVFAPLGVLGLLALRRRRRLADTLLWTVAPFAIVSYFAARDFKVFHPRYVAVALPCMLLAIAAALADLRPFPRRVFATALAALWSVSLYHHFFVPAYGREDYRGALAAVRAHAAPGEQVLAVGSPEPVEFYGRGLRVERWWLGWSAQPDRMQAKFEVAVAKSGGTWVVLSRSEDLDPQDRFARWLALRYPRAGRMGFTGVRVWYLAPAHGATPGADRPATTAS